MREPTVTHPTTRAGLLGEIRVLERKLELCRQGNDNLARKVVTLLEEVRRLKGAGRSLENERGGGL